MTIPPELIGNLAYLASPYGRYESGPAQAFADIATVAGKLVAAGIPLYCPIVHSHPMAVYAELGDDLSIWNPLNDQFMALCRALIIVHLEGWEQSEGIKREVEYFEAQERPIYDCDPVSLTLVRRVERPDKGPQLPLRYHGDENDPYVLAHAKSPSEQGGASV